MSFANQQNFKFFVLSEPCELPVNLEFNGLKILFCGILRINRVDAALRAVLLIIRQNWCGGFDHVVRQGERGKNCVLAKRRH